MDDLEVLKYVMVFMAAGLLGFASAYYLMKGLRDESVGNDHFGDRIGDGNLGSEKHGK